MFHIPVEIAFERKTILKSIQRKFVDEKREREKKRQEMFTSFKDKRDEALNSFVIQDSHQKLRKKRACPY